MPPPEELPELVELPEEDSRATYARNTAVMTVGTTLSRITGFLRIAAQTAALQRLLGDVELVERIGAAATERAAGFTWARTADGMIDAYRDAAR